MSKNLNLISTTDWLLDRRHCDVKWQAAVLEIREKINAAIQDMPPVDEITQLLSGTCEFYATFDVVLLLLLSFSMWMVGTTKQQCRSDILRITSTGHIYMYKQARQCLLAL